MTFEEYKKKMEVFGKIDTEEKLAFYKHQYENHLLRKEDQNHFQPLEESVKDSLSNQYEQNLHNIFNLSQIKENEFSFLVTPSFEPEYQLILIRNAANYQFTCKTLKSNYWHVFYADNKVAKIESTLINLDAENRLGDKLFCLFNKIMDSARPPKGNFFTLDGVRYMISKTVNGNIKSVMKSSPDEDSYTGKFISAMEVLYNIIQASDTNWLKDLENKIDMLLD